MTHGELLRALKTLGMPVAYGSFTSTPENPAPPPPFITFQFAYSGDMMADNRNHVSIENYQVELYTVIKDLVKESVLQAKLKELELPYSKSEQRLEDEKVYQVIYEVQLIGG